MLILAGAVVDGEDVTGPKPRLYATNGFEVDAKTGVSCETVASGVLLVHLGLALQFEDGDELLDTRQCELLTGDGVAKHETVFECLQPVIAVAPVQYGKSHDGLKCEMSAEPQIVKNLRDDFG